MGLPVSTVAHARIMTPSGHRILASVNDDAEWTCPDTGLRLLLRAFHGSPAMAQAAFRVAGEPAHIIAAAAVRQFGGVLITRHPDPPDAPDPPDIH